MSSDYTEGLKNSLLDRELNRMLTITEAAELDQADPLSRLGLGLAKIVSIGNKADLNDDMTRRIKEAAELLGVSCTSLRRYANEGKLKVYRIGPGKHRRFRKRDVLEYLENNSEY